MAQEGLRTSRWRRDLQVRDEDRLMCGCALIPGPTPTLPLGLFAPPHAQPQIFQGGRLICFGLPSRFPPPSLPSLPTPNLKMVKDMLKPSKADEKRQHKLKR